MKIIKKYNVTTCYYSVDTLDDGKFVFDKINIY